MYCTPFPFFLKKTGSNIPSEESRNVSLRQIIRATKACPYERLLGAVKKISPYFSTLIGMKVSLRQNVHAKYILTTLKVFVTRYL
jgi:hypothetical protein